MVYRQVCRPGSAPQAASHLSLTMRCLHRRRAFALLFVSTAAAAQRPVSVPIAGDTVSLATATGRIAGTLVVPPGSGPVPLVVIIAGSGPTDRDGNSSMLPGQNNSLRLLAEGIAARGIASLRYDKRGIAASRAAGPSEADLRFDMYADDAAAWVRRFRGDPRFSTITVIGHSEGSLIGMLATQRAMADGFVSIAGPGRRADLVIREQLRSNPANPPDLIATADRALDTLVAGHTLSTPATGPLAGLFRPSVQPYMISWFRADPQVEIARLTVPVLIVQGTTDTQVRLTEADLLAKAQPRASRATIDGMNHVLKRADSSPGAQAASYSNPSLPVAPQLIDAVAMFVATVRRR
jgi:pimeloyl-ACP methyl ester carboxylesterase